MPDADIVAMIRKVAAAEARRDRDLLHELSRPRISSRRLEQETGIPIYDTTSIGVWDALRRAGVDDRRGARWGSLFTGT